MTIDSRFTKKEAFAVDIAGNMLMLPINAVTLDFIKLLAGSKVFSSTYTRTMGVVYYPCEYNVEIKLVDANVFNDPAQERQYAAIRDWDEACINAKELAEATEG